MSIAVESGKKTPGTARNIGRYELKEELGAGGMGVVWQALDTRIGGDVAVKIIKDCSDPAALELFAKEWRVLADLCHPNIVDVRDVDVLVENGEQKPFFVMPLLRGAPLSRLIKASSERLTVARVVEIVTQVCRGLQAAHQRGLVHRDLKPSNIFVMDDDTAKVIDFGVVYLAGSDSITGHKGTLQYMSPEQIQRKAVTPASDLFSLGVTLYEALTGRQPFARATVEETEEAVLKHIPPPVSELNPGIPHGVSQVVNKCLAKQPIHRFSSARELADMLQRGLRGEEVFDRAKLRLRLDRVRGALKNDDAFASELLSELESEGHLDPEITHLRTQIDASMKQRKVRQLIESARARIEQGEIALGLDKLREALELDPDNVDAAALKTATENKRSEEQAAKWVELGTRHLENNDFGAARQNAQEALVSHPGDPRALDLLNRVETVEAEARRVRERKEQLYNTAMKAYQNGEIESALSRLAQLFSVVRSRPEGAVPERDAVYENFYQQVRSEHDSIRLVLEQAQREFSEENFERALELCAEHLERYPHDGTFQALKIQIEDRERQKVSEYVAMVTKTADAEPDLDRRANVLREAMEKYPKETQFAQPYRVVCERRDLVNSIVAKARQFLERGQYSEALSQWDMLRNIHPRFPGLSFELEQCRKKRDQQAQEEERARQVEEIVRLMDQRDYGKAVERAQLALKDFPGDTELIGLERLSREGQERASEISKLLTQGQGEAAARDWKASAESLRRALSLDPRNLAVKEALIFTLTEHSRALLETDWEEARRLQLEGAGLDPQHRLVKTLATEILEARRQSFVGQCLTDARVKVQGGDYDGAYELMRKAREEYPNDVRLQQYEAWLLKESRELQIKKEREKRLAELEFERARLEREPASDRARELLRRSREAKQKAPDDPETIRIVSAAEATIRHAARTEDLDSLLGRTDSVPVRERAVADDLEPTRLEPKQKKVAEKKAAGAVLPQRRGLVAAGIALLLLLIAGATWLVWSFSHSTTKTTSISVAPPQGPAPAAAKVHVSATPADSTILVDGAAVSGGEINVLAGRTVKVDVSRAGYKSATLTLDGKATPQAITLLPLPARVTISTDEKSGGIELDGTRVAELSDGVAEGLEVPADGKPHTLAVVAGAKRPMSVRLATDAGSKPRLEPIKSEDFVGIASFGPQATIYGGQQLGKAQINGATIRFSDKGTDLPALDSGANELTFMVGNDKSSLSVPMTDGPAVSLHALGAQATLLITSNVSGATLTVNGRPMKRGRSGWQIAHPGSYQLSMAANGFETQTWTDVLKPRQSLTDPRTLVLKVVVATVSSLAIMGGTAGARVEADGKPLGELDGAGAGQFKGVLSAGTHRVQMQKEGFCDRSQSVDARPPADVQLAASKLDACGTLLVKVGEQPYAVKLRRTDVAGARETEFQVNNRIQLPVGEYHLIADLPGQPRFEEDFSIKAGANLEIPLQPTRARSTAQACTVVNSADVTPATDGFLKPNGGGYLALTRGCVNGLVLTFGKPKGGWLPGRRKIDWTVRAGGGSGQVEYSLEGDKLTRKTNVHGEQAVEAKADKLKANADTFSVRIQVEGQHIRVLSAAGDVVDDYEAADPSLVNLRGGQVSVKTSGVFKVGGGA